MTEACPLWSSEQHAWLEALGHTVWMQGALPEPAAASAAMPAQAPTRPVREAVAPVRRAPVAPAAPVSVDAAPVTRAAVARRPGARMPDRLHFALIRASGCNPNAPGAAELIASWPAASELRGNPAAKRALWPRLRALRKQGQP
jgi:hypothetical protein